jgi:hypothetical protein
MRTLIVILLASIAQAEVSEADATVSNTDAKTDATASKTDDMHDLLGDLDLKELDNLDDKEMDELVDKLSDKLLDRALGSMPDLSQMNLTDLDLSQLDDTTLGKPAGAESDAASGMDAASLHEQMQKVLDNLPESVKNSMPTKEDLEQLNEKLGALDSKDGSALFAHGSDQAQVAMEAATWAAAAAAFAAVAVEEAVQEAALERDDDSAQYGQDADDEDAQDFTQYNHDGNDEDADTQPEDEELEELDEDQTSGYSLPVAGLFGIVLGSAVTLAATKVRGGLKSTEQPLLGNAAIA